MNVRQFHNPGAFVAATALVVCTGISSPAGARDDGAAAVLKVEAIKPGAPEAEVRARLPGSVCVPHPHDAATVRCDGGPEGRVQYAGHPVERAEFGFERERLVSIDMNVQTNHEPVATAISKRYGQPTSAAFDSNVGRYRGHVVYSQRIAGGYLILRDRIGYRYRIPDSVRRYWQKGDVLVGEVRDNYEFRLGQRE